MDSELCTFRDPSVDADASDAVQFVSFQVSSSPNDENTTRNDIKVGQFVWRGVLQIPPEQKLVANEDGTDNNLANGETMLIKVKNESGDLLGSVEYLRRPPVAYNEKVFMYFYAESSIIRWKLFIRYIKHGLRWK